MFPTPYIAPVSPPPAGSPVSRALKALADGRLPYQVQQHWDRVAIKLGMGERTVDAGGLKVRVRRQTCDEMFVANIIENNEYTRDGYGIAPGEVVIDIGGNIGTFALDAARTASRVFTVEPNSDNFRLLQHNLLINGAKNIVPIKSAMGASTGTVELACTSEGGFHSTTEGMKKASVKTESVSCIRLQDLFHDFGIDRCHFLKVDCEGAEYEIFENLPDEYFARIDKIAMEWHGVEDIEERRQKAISLAALLAGKGFKIDLFLEYTGFRSGMIKARRT